MISLTTLLNLNKGKKASFVLLHGAWYTSGCWNRIISILEKEGHRVDAIDFPYYTATTPKEITRKDFIKETLLPALKRILTETGQSPILVGHSLAGTIISEAAEAAPEYIKSLVFIAGFMLPNQTSILDLRKHRNQTKAIQKIGAIIHPKRVYNKFDVASLDRDTAVDRFCQDCSQSDQELFLRIVNWDMPQEPIRTKVQLGENYARIPKYYIKTLRDRSISIEEQMFMIQQTPCEKIFSIDSGHSPFFNKPNVIAKFLQEISSQSIPSPTLLTVPPVTSSKQHANSGTRAVFRKLRYSSY